MNNILPVFLPFIACGNKCTYCNQSAITNHAEPTDLLSSTISQIEQYKKYSNNWNELAYYGGNFGAIDKNIRVQLYEIAHNAGINNIRYSTRPDTISDTLLKEATQYGINHIELGVQSLSNEALKMNKRPYTSDDVFDAIRNIQTVATCGVQVMVGMYGTDELSVVEDAKKLANTGVTTARIYPTIVLSDTELAELYKQEKYIPLDFERMLLLTTGAYIEYMSKDINVIRIGLPSEVYQSDNYIAGAYHNALGDVVKTMCALLYASYGNGIKFAGYKGLVKAYDEQLYKNASDNVDFNVMCRYLKENLLEDSKWHIEGKAVEFAKRFTR